MRSLGRFPDPLYLNLLRQARRPWWKRWRKRRRRFRVTADYHYVTSAGVYLRVPEGTVVDFASIPCIAWRVIGQPVGDYAEASVVHDYLWDCAARRLRLGKPQEGFGWANEVFLDAMRTLGVASWRRWVMWLAVTVNGWWQAKRIARRFAKIRP